MKKGKWFAGLEDSATDRRQRLAGGGDGGIDLLVHLPLKRVCWITVGLALSPSVWQTQALRLTLWMPFGVPTVHWRQPLDRIITVNLVTFE